MAGSILGSLISKKYFYVQCTSLTEKIQLWQRWFQWLPWSSASPHQKRVILTDINFCLYSVSKCWHLCSEFTSSELISLEQMVKWSQVPTMHKPLVVLYIKLSRQSDCISKVCTLIEGTKEWNLFTAGYSFSLNIYIVHKHYGHCNMQFCAISLVWC